jgi:hypothetical protein
MVYLDTFLHGDEVTAFFIMLMSHSALLYRANKKTRHQHHYTTWRHHTHAKYSILMFYIMLLPDSNDSNAHFVKVSEN